MDEYVHSPMSLHCPMPHERFVMAGLHSVLALGDPTIPPMARMPFTNTVPDYVVTGPSFAAEGYGGILAAGFFDYLWRAPEHALSFSARC